MRAEDASPKPKAALRSFRLHLAADLAAGAEIALPREAAHYVGAVMRAARGERFHVFNRADGEWLVEIVADGKRSVAVRAIERTRPPAPPPDLQLLFAPVKKARTDFIVEKACELGCRAVGPTFTLRTGAERVNADRLEAHMVEAAEQCGLVWVPSLLAPMRLSERLAAWEPERTLYFCDEARTAPPLARALTSGPAAILIGPEGGFAPEEAKTLRAAPFVRAASLGPRVLRADTAAVAALTLWQSVVGDWAPADTGE